MGADRMEAKMTTHGNTTGDYTHAEIAAAFEMKWQNVQQAEQRGLERIRSALGFEDWSPVQVRVIRAGRMNGRLLLQSRES